MRGLNRVTLLGNLGQDPETRKLDGNVSVVRFSLATSEVYKDEHGQTKTHTEWHTIVLWRSLAELAEKYLKKGSLICIEGKLRTRTYEDKKGEKRYVTEVIGENIMMLDKKEKTE